MDGHGNQDAGPCSDARFEAGSDHPAVVSHVGVHRFEVGPDRVWAVIDDIRRFPRLWSWLHGFEADRHRLQPGLVMRGTIVAPVPYRLRLTVEIDEMERRRSVQASVRGDLAGPAAVVLRETTHGCELTVCWRMEMRRPALRAAAHVARPLLVWGQDRVVAMTVRGFRRSLEAPP